MQYVDVIQNLFLAFHLRKANEKRALDDRVLVESSLTLFHTIVAVNHEVINHRVVVDTPSLCLSCS